MDLNNLLTTIAFIIGIIFAGYLLTHIKLIINDRNEWRAPSILALGVLAFLFFAFSHPKVTKIVADVLGAKIEVANLEEKIENYKLTITELDKEKNRKQSELANLDKKYDENFIAKITKPLIQTLASSQKIGQSLAIFQNQIAINPQMAATKLGVKELPEKFKNLPADAWVVIPDSEEIASTHRAATATTSKQPILNQTFVISPSTGKIFPNDINSSDKEFLNSLIEKQKTTKPADQN